MMEKRADRVQLGLVPELGELTTQVRYRALDVDTRAVAAMVTGDRPERTATGLFEALTQEYRGGAISLTDFWPAYRAALPGGRHGECNEGDGLTKHIERSWCTLRQRCARFVRKTLSFSECPLDHFGAL